MWAIMCLHEELRKSVNTSRLVVIFPLSFSSDIQINEKYINLLETFRLTLIALKPASTRIHL